MIRYTTYRYSADRGLPCDWDSLLALGLAAARYARWLGIPPARVPEGPPAQPLQVHTWPEHVFDYVLAWRPQPLPAVHQSGRVFSQYGGAVLDDSAPWDGDDIRAYGPHSDPGYEPEVIPPWCPLPRGDQALRDIGY